MECILSPHDIINQSDYNVPVIIFGFPGISDIHCNQFLLKKNQLQAMVRLRFACYFAQMVFYPLPNTCTVLPFPGRNFELKRENIKLLEVLGEGQFGDVFKGLFTDKVGA